MKEQDIKIGYKTYRGPVMKDVFALAPALGTCNNVSGEIIMSTGLNPEEQTNTMIHEMLHGIFHVYNIDSKAEEEYLVTCIANGLTGVMRDNPKLFPMLQRQLK